MHLLMHFGRLRRIQTLVQLTQLYKWMVIFVFILRIQLRQPGVVVTMDAPFIHIQVHLQTYVKLFALRARIFLPPILRVFCVLQVHTPLLREQFPPALPVWTIWRRGCIGGRQASRRLAQQDLQVVH